MKIMNILVICIVVGALAVVGCVETSNSYKTGSVAIEQNQARLLNSTPIPTVTNSIERKNIIDRINVLNDQSKLFYIYLFSNDGNLIMSFTGTKVSSLNSYLTPQEQVIDDPNGDYAVGSLTVQAPDLDGTYGVNADGVFFFTSDHKYVEWNGMYLMSEKPLSVITPADIVQIQGA